MSDAIAWPTLKGETGSFVDALLADQHNDLLFSSALRIGTDVIAYVLLEHQSTADSDMPLRVLSYDDRLWQHHRKKQRSAALPPIIAVVVSHAPGGWTASPHFAEMFDRRVLAAAGFAALVPQFSLIIFDLARQTDAELKALPLPVFPKLALWLLRDARDPPRLLARFDAWIEEWTQLEPDDWRPRSFAALVRYIFNVVPPTYHDALRVKFALLGARAKESAMTIAEHLHEEGRRQGLEQGLRQGRREALVTALRSLLVGKFHVLEASDEARLRAADADALERYLQRVLSARSRADVFVD